MATKAELKAVLTLNNVGFVRAIKQSIQFAKNLARQFKAAPIQTTFNAGILSMRGVFKGAASVIGTVGGAIIDTFKFIGMAGIAAGTAVAGGLAAITAEAIHVASKIEDLTTSFNFLLGSSTKGAAKMKELWELASSRGMSMDEAATGARKLQLLTNGAIHSKKALETVADVSTVMGESFDGTAEKLGQLYTMMMAGQPVTRQLKELEKGGALTGHQAKEISGLAAGGLSVEAWMKLEEALSRWHGSFAAKSNNWTIWVGKFKTSIDKALAAFGKPIMDAMKPALDYATKTVEFIATALPEVGKKFGMALQSAVDILVAIFQDPMSIVNPLIDALKAGAAEFGNLMVAGVEAAFKMLGNQAFWDGVSGILMGIAEMFEGKFLIAFQAPVAYLTAGIEMAIDKMKGAWAFMTGGTGPKEKSMDERFNEIMKGNSIAKMGEKMVKDGSKDLSGGIKVVFDAATEALKSVAVDDIFGAGEHMTKAMEGITALRERGKKTMDRYGRPETGGTPAQVPWFQQRMDKAQIRSGRFIKESGMTSNDFYESILKTGSFKESMANAGQALNGGASGRTPLIRARERRQLENTRRAEILARTGQREGGSTMIRRGDRARARAIQKEAQRTKTVEENQLKVQQSIEEYLKRIDTGFDSLVGD